ncbi:hypothetical protein AAC387_Pa05g0418 [Persea americana]
MAQSCIPLSPGFSVLMVRRRNDSIGIPHILEHSVLCGSRKYPLKEPFVELLKGSLNTFLNAFTYPDRTCYPVASTNAKALQARWRMKPFHGHSLVLWRFIPLWYCFPMTFWPL